MPAKLVLLWEMPDELMLIVAHPSGVAYQNQVGGVTCDQPRLEGILAPLAVSRRAKERIEGLDYSNGALGISSGLADSIDAQLAAEPVARFVSVDRSRLDDCQEAWIYVLIASPQDIDYQREPRFLGSVFGFGAAKGVLTWINSD
jgi:hypothetical protein